MLSLGLDLALRADTNNAGGSFVIVKTVMDGSLAATCGADLLRVLPGDQILSINGTDLTTLQPRQVLDLLRSSEKITMVLQNTSTGAAEGSVEPASPAPAQHTQRSAPFAISPAAISLLQRPAEGDEESMDETMGVDAPAGSSVKVRRSLSDAEKSIAESPGVNASSAQLDTTHYHSAISATPVLTAARGQHHAAETPMSPIFPPHAPHASSTPVHAPAQAQIAAAAKVSPPLPPPEGNESLEEVDLGNMDPLGAVVLPSVPSASPSAPGKKNKKAAKKAESSLFSDDF
jgi:hypothetical protein